MDNIDVEEVLAFINSASWPLSRTRADIILATITHLRARAEQAERERDEMITVLQGHTEEMQAAHNAITAANERVKGLSDDNECLRVKAAQLQDRSEFDKGDIRILRTQLAARDSAIAESLRRADAVTARNDLSVQDVTEPLRQFQQPEPDKLVEAVKDCGYATLDAIEPEFADDLRTALAARGGRVVFDGEGE